jgi:hypothetical protein
MERRLTEKEKKANEKILDELEFGFSCKRVIHQGWREHLTLQKSKDPQIKKFMKERMFKKPMFGKWSYVYNSEKGIITLINVQRSYINNGYPWEIYSGGKLFPDIERFRTKKEAEIKIKEYLCPKMLR